MTVFWLMVVFGPMLALCLYSWNKQRFFKKYGIRTKKTTLIVGDLPLIIKKGLGYLTLEDIRQNGKVFGTFVGNLPSLIVTDVDIIRLMMTKEFPTFMNRANTPFPEVRGGERLLPNSQGDDWKLVRNKLSPAFSIAKLKPMATQINHCLKTFDDHMVEKLESNPDGFDIIPLLKNFTLDVILHVGLGIETDTQTNPNNGFVKHALEFLEFNPVNPLLLVFFILPELKNITKFLNLTPFPKESIQFYEDALKAMIEHRKQFNEPRKDLLQLMIDAKNTHIEDSKVIQTERETISDKDVTGNAVICMIAGYDTTSSSLAWFVYDMIVHPECQQKLINEIDKQLGQTEATYDNVFTLPYLDMVLSETLRIHPPGSNIMRMATDEIELCGVHIPKGIEISIPLTVLHFMPEHWENPSEYIPERFSPENKANIETYAYMPFGLGPRNCIATRLAIMELKLTIVNIFQNFRLRRAADLQIPLPAKRMLVISPAAPLRIIAERRTRR